MTRLGVAPALAADALGALRVLAAVCRAWRRALLPRAWAAVVLAGAPGPAAADLHALAAPCVRRLVVPWGAMSAPAPWSAAHHAGSAGDASDSDDSADSDAASLHAARRSDRSDRLRAVFGAAPWPAAAHLDMAFMPLVCYQGLADHLRRALPRLRTLRVGGFVPATALAEILLPARLPLEALEISASVWANADGPRRGSASSWRSSASTAIAADPAGDGPIGVAADGLVGGLVDGLVDGLADGLADGPAKPALVCQPALSPQLQPLAALAVTADALRSPTVFAFAMAQRPTLRTLCLLECDYKIIDMLRTGRLEERHMHAVEWAAAPPMVLPSQAPPAAAAAHARDAEPARWPALSRLHIERFHMAPHAAAALCIAADAMPALADLAIDRMEPSDARHPAPA
ncbi:hypothetical protein H4R21_006335, partial [Coemansia helicoidea]